MSISYIGGVSLNVSPTGNSSIELVYTPITGNLVVVGVVLSWPGPPNFSIPSSVSVVDNNGNPLALVASETGSTYPPQNAQTYLFEGVAQSGATHYTISWSGGLGFNAIYANGVGILAEYSSVSGIGTSSVGTNTDINSSFPSASLTTTADNSKVVTIVGLGTFTSGSFASVGGTFRGVGGGQGSIVNGVLIEGNGSTPSLVVNSMIIPQNTGWNAVSVELQS